MGKSHKVDDGVVSPWIAEGCRCNSNRKVNHGKTSDVLGSKVIVGNLSHSIHSLQPAATYRWTLSTHHQPFPSTNNVPYNLVLCLTSQLRCNLQFRS